ncbi:MAG: hypothetical protein LBH01_00070 [Verrucomicrobiales bacterium]|jgi:DNA-binding LacI/PurR family transcriptional regulator|nr:hypothetical protein [Verrucomicrobiales bacterium]
MTRVTLKDIADKLGFSVSYTARAFKGRPGIPPLACQKVREMAGQLGYQPDPMLTALSAYRQARKPAAFQGTLAFLTTEFDEKRWLATPETGDLLNGARERAESLGYRIEYFNIGKDHKTHLRVWKMLRSRGIRGAIIRALPFELHRFDVPFGQFPHIYLFSEPHVPTAPAISSYHAQSMELVLQELLKRGYRHPALVLSSELSEFLHHSWRMAFYAHATKFARHAVHSHEKLEINPVALSRWLKQERADVLIYCTSENFIPKLPGTRQSDCVCMDLLYPDCGVAGIYQNRRHGGSVAVDWMQSMLLTAQAGNNPNPHVIMIPGIWKEGTGSLKTGSH